ncbi:WAT1-related protein At5g47470-like [Prosopis cineraria]|uniref:WAT1-related protein At5g47470-like n=1 Tax=Prosopis cineraria TaxID=364024 RepID=UPI00240FB3B9|nr:WAT1-related protein At5g47470-like [Prosopis cineraria]
MAVKTYKHASKLENESNGCVFVMAEMVRESMAEDLAIAGGLIAVQFITAVHAVFQSYLMTLEIDPLTLVIFTCFSTFLVVFPFAIYFERTKWPQKFSFKLILQILILSFGGVTLFQSFSLKGMKLTSPTMGTAMPNLAPGLIFFIAWTFRLEKINVRSIYSKVKILGTIICVAGALAMSIMQSISSPATKIEAGMKLPSFPPDAMFDMKKIKGCLYLVAAVFILSSAYVLQALTLRDFPAPISLSAAISLLGAFMTAIAQLLEDHKLKTGGQYLSVAKLIGFTFLAGAVLGLCFSFHGWAVKKKGPVLVSMFSPISTVCSIILSAVTLGDTINIGSLVGMFLMFTGLYFVLWAKGKEGFADADSLEAEFDAEKPLLS